MAQAPVSGSGGSTGTKTKSKSGGNGATPQDIWNELEFQGATAVQAAAIMGNAIAESSLNPESKALDSNGYYSYGLWQFNTAPGNYPDAASLVTGNPAKDVKAQVKYLIRAGGLKAASGNTVPKAASNFASGFERCSSCQSGGVSNNQRQGLAVQVSDWAAGGNWPTSSLTATDSSTLSQADAQQASDSCAWQIGGGSFYVGLGYHQSVPSFCVLSKGQARALLSAGILVGGTIVGLFGIALLFSTTSIGKAAARGVTSALAVVPK